MNSDNAEAITLKETITVKKKTHKHKVNPGFYLVLDYFRQANAEGLHLCEQLNSAIQTSTGEDQQAATDAFNDVQHLIHRKTREAARQQATLIEDLRRSDLEDLAWYAHEFTEVKNCWEDLEQQWANLHAEKEPAAKLAKRAQKSIDLLDNLAFICACQAIPDELDHYLDNYRIGEKLDFVEVFKNQVSDAASAKRVLANLAPQSGFVSGLIDLTNAQVIKADRRIGRQWASVGLVLGAVALGFVLIGFATQMPWWFHWDAKDWPFEGSQFRALSGAFLLVLTGVVGHWVLDRVKLNRAGTDATPLSEWLMWIHVNEVPLIVRIGTAWLTLALGVAFKVFSLAGSVQPVAFFTAGYFLDSTFDALMGRLNTFMSSKDPKDTKADKNGS
jgi:hypothetical protein